MRKPKNKNILSKDAVRNIMAVDDDDDILITIKTGLEEQGFKVHTFNTGESALEAFEHHPPDYYDLVLTDISMPNMNGFTLYLSLKEKRPSLKIAFMTASVDIPMEAVASSIEPDYIIQKPFQLTDLATRIKYILQKTASSPMLFLQERASPVQVLSISIMPSSLFSEISLLSIGLSISLDSFLPIGISPSNIITTFYILVVMML